MEYDVAILGGGAAGLAAAVTAAEAGARVVVLEASARIGRPILASGNGRCNFSNARIQADAYRNAAFVGKALDAFEAAAAREAAAAGRSGEQPPNGVVAFFQRRGLMWREEAEGRLYPLANKASVVLDVLRACLDAGGVEVRCDAPVQAVEPPRAPGKPFMVRLSDGALAHARAVIAACGGASARQLLPDGFAYTDPRPALGPIATDTRWVRRLDNIRVRCAASLVRDGRPLHRERGELLFRAYGISGIMVFNLSRLAQPGDIISLDFMPDIPADQMGAFLRERAQMLEQALGTAPTDEDLLRGMVLPPIAEVLVRRDGALAGLLKAFTLECAGIGDERNCQVRRGGFAVEAFDPRTCEACAVPGLHVVGEALDVDGPCGGYNLHWAFATGMMAGRHAAARAQEG